MSFPENTEGRNASEVKSRFTSVFNQLNSRFNNSLSQYRQISNMNDRTTKALSTSQRLLRNMTFKTGKLSNQVSGQIGILDTKNRQIEIAEDDINVNQNIIKILYIILIGVAISIVIMLISFFMKLGNGSTSSSSSAEPSIFDKLGSYFTLGTTGNTYKGTLTSNEGGITGNLFKMGGNKK